MNSQLTTDEALEKIRAICDGYEYDRTVPYEAVEIAEKNACVIVVGGSDDLMYVYGAECYMTWCEEHSYGWHGDTLEGEDVDPDLKSEASQIGLRIWWCGRISPGSVEIPGYDTAKSGAFSYTVKEGIEYRDFKIMEDGDVYCTGKVIKLPEGFQSAKYSRNNNN